MRALRLLLAMALLLITAPALSSSDPARFKIMGVRLYMTAEEVLAALRWQARALNLQDHPCRGDPSSRCIEQISAELPDGRLEVRFIEAPQGSERGPELAGIITLSIRAGSGATEAVLRAAAIDHYGPPASPETMSWCASPRLLRADCPADQPVMHFAPGLAGNVAGMLTLSDPGLATRFASPANPARTP